MLPAEDREGLYASPQAIAFHREQVVFDGLSLQYILDEPYVERHLEGGVTATNLTVATENQDWDQVLRTVEASLEKVARHPDLTLATTSEHVRAAKRDGKIAVILGTQGSDFFGSQIWRVDILHRLGIRFVGLAYTGATLLGDGCGETRDAGLSFLGRDFIERVNALPVLLDLSHSGHRTRREAVELALHPICTHSNSYAVHANDRNTKDEVVAAIAGKSGVVGLCGMPRSVADRDPTIGDMLPSPPLRRPCRRRPCRDRTRLHGGLPGRLPGRQGHPPGPFLAHAAARHLRLAGRFLHPALSSRTPGHQAFAEPDA